jgi:hypothetical protein
VNGLEDMNPELIDLELLIRKPPESVRAWWTEYPDDYYAKDPREQPYHISTTRRLPNGREVRTYWNMPDGSKVEVREILTMKPDGSWTYDVPYPNPTGVHVFDEFRTESTAEGTKLLIHSTLTPEDASATSRVSGLKEFMIQSWKLAAQVCEHDAP